MVKLDDKLHRDARAYAAKHGITLAALIEEALRLRLAKRMSPKSSEPLRLPTFRGDGLQPGVSLDDMETVYDRMDGVR
ncbi:MAG: DUF2191 domain-containing protein [Acidobacteria bacterium]|nr:MAG: DUF2191 domain-containing protein [Acidobacteriota bacterium]